MRLHGAGHADRRMALVRRVPGSAPQTHHRYRQFYGVGYVPGKIGGFYVRRYPPRRREGGGLRRMGTVRVQPRRVGSGDAGAAYRDYFAGHRGNRAADGGGAPVYLPVLPPQSPGHDAPDAARPALRQARPLPEVQAGNARAGTGKEQLTMIQSNQPCDPLIHQAARRLAWRNVGTIENLLRQEEMSEAAREFYEAAREEMETLKASLKAKGSA